MNDKIENIINNIVSMAYNDKEIAHMKNKLQELKKLRSFMIDMGEDTNIVSEKIRELENELKNA